MPTRLLGGSSSSMAVAPFGTGPAARAAATALSMAARASSRSRVNLHHVTHLVTHFLPLRGPYSTGPLPGLGAAVR